MRPWLTLACGLYAAAFVSAAALHAQPQPSAQPRRDVVQELQEKLASGQLRLEHKDDASGYLTSVLKLLDIPVESQVLVFSKTSFQAPLISPGKPRAIYFNDDTAVGFVQGGKFLELTTTGADGRVAFYTLNASTAASPAFERDSAICMSCHVSVGSTGGLIVANVMPQEDGTPLFITIDRLFDVSDATTPFDRRWGGWYVTGQHGEMKHNGNVHLTEDHPYDLDPKAGLNVADLSSRLDLRPYPVATSDIVALMTFEHQLGAMNRIWRLQAQGRPSDVEDLVAYLVGVGEAPLPSPVTGASTFSRTFAARGPRDGAGRSLRDFDLQTRLFRYPLSYVVYSRAFEGLEADLREQVYRRLFDVLSGADTSAKYASIPLERRRAALEILAATKSDLPAYWRSDVRPVAAR